MNIFNNSSTIHNTLRKLPTNNFGFFFYYSGINIGTYICVYEFKLKVPNRTKDSLMLFRLDFTVAIILFIFLYKVSPKPGFHVCSVL